MTLRQLILVWAALMFAAPVASLGAAPAPRSHVLMDSAWRFRNGDADFGGRDVDITGWSLKADPAVSSLAVAALPPDLDGGAWQPESDLNAASLRTRTGFLWLRAALPAVPSPSPVLHFESVSGAATVFVNGKRLAEGQRTYAPFDLPLAGVWVPGGPNTVVVLVQKQTLRSGVSGPITVQGADPALATGPAAPGYDDRAWRTLHLPHDYVVEGAFDHAANAAHAFLPAGIGWYRKTFTLPAADRGRTQWLEFDGVYRDSRVWLNGHFLGEHPSGYTGFYYDIGKYANYGGRNVLAVRADAHRFEGWWYEGGGIYRHVWLTTLAPTHVSHWGTFVTSAVPGGDRGRDDLANVTLQTTLDDDTPRPVACTLVSQVIAPDGRVVATARSARTLAPGANPALAQSVRLTRPALWSIETPNLYRLHTVVVQGGKAVDAYDTPFGVRTIRFDANKGFFLNGRHVEIKGTCNHQDFAGVGIGMPDSVLYWRVKQLKAMGSNAYRMSHNPPAPELLDACDRLGMLVMDENRHLGDTFTPKSGGGTPYADLSELTGMIRRDRNHPSIFLWSLCNEEGLQGSAEGAAILTAMKNVARREDPTRPVTTAMNGAWGTGFSAVEDVQGSNYLKNGDYDAFHQKFPAQPVIGTEESSAVFTRGVYAVQPFTAKNQQYFGDPVQGYTTAYDLSTPPWGSTAEGWWSYYSRRPYIAGGFIWTGFDYKGEPTPFTWPCVNGGWGAMDACGFPKDTFYYYQGMWGDRPLVHLLPHWNWAGREGQQIPVWAYSNAAKVELSLNGKSLGAQDVPQYGHVEWSVPYAPGTLTATGYDGAGKVVATDTVATTGAPAALTLTTDRAALTADGEDTAVVRVSVVDAQGRVVPTAGDAVTFHLSGPALLAGVGNGDPSSHESDKATARRAFNGHCMALVQATDAAGPVRLTATAPGLRPASLALASHRKGR